MSTELKNNIIFKTTNRTTVFDIPLDAWIVILRFIDKQNLVETFNKLFDSEILNIPQQCRIDTFWIVVSQSRYIDECEKEVELPEPNGLIHKNCLDKLVEMGVNKESALNVVRKTNGDFHGAMEVLGWLS
jgi:hypothetical protein